MSLRTAVASASRATAVRRAAVPVPVPVFARAASSQAAAASSSSSSSAPQWELPDIHLGQTHSSRYHEHYDATLATDLMYMAYNHRATATAEAAAANADKQTTVLKTGYESNRPAAPLRGNRPHRPIAKGITPETIPRLESITLHTMVREAIGNKHALLSAIMAFRAISGESAQGGGRTGSSGVKVVVSRTGAAQFKLRAGMPVATTVEIRGEAMYDFIQSLVDFVLPRIREFPGFVLPPQSASKTSPSALSGVVSVGLPPAAMGLFPQIEGNLDAYPKLHGFHIHFKTNQRGKDAQEHSRALLSGFRIPFARK